MNHFFIITNALKDKNLELTTAICEYITAKNGICSYTLCVDQEGNIHKNTIETISDDTECIFVLGGDGTLIRAARDTISKKIPLIGINRGKLGYLCELEEDSVFTAIDQLMQDCYTTENRTMLTGYSVKNSKKLVHKNALNDIVIHRGGSPQLLHLIVYVNGEFLFRYMADGILVATATGSTGYNLSAGGPIVDPKANILLLSPINSHTLNARSIVLSPNDEITIEIGYRRMEKDENAQVSFDGENSLNLEVGDKIVIKKSEDSAKILRLSNVSFLEILRKKMQIYT